MCYPFIVAQTEALDSRIRITKALHHLAVLRFVKVHLAFLGSPIPSCKPEVLNLCVEASAEIRGNASRF